MFLEKSRVEVASFLDKPRNKAESYLGKSWNKVESYLGKSWGEAAFTSDKTRYKNIVPEYDLDMSIYRNNRNSNRPFPNPRKVLRPNFPRRNAIGSSQILNTWNRWNEWVP